MKRISKKVRDEAILICAIAASTPRLSQDYESVSTETGIANTSDGFNLAMEAWGKCWLLLMTMQSAVDAEAECLLRDGWSPGDPVELL